MPYFTQTPHSFLPLPTIKDAYRKFEIKITFRPDSADGEQQGTGPGWPGRGPRGSPSPALWEGTSAAAPRPQAPSGALPPASAPLHSSSVMSQPPRGPLPPAPQCPALLSRLPSRLLLAPRRLSPGPPLSLVPRGSLLPGQASFSTRVSVCLASCRRKLSGAWSEFLSVCQRLSAGPLFRAPIL